MLLPSLDHRRTIAVPGQLHLRISLRNPKMKLPRYGDGTEQVCRWRAENSTDRAWVALRVAIFVFATFAENFIGFSMASMRTQPRRLLVLDWAFFTLLLGGLFLL